MLIIELSSEKHALQNIQNDCYEGLSDSCRVHQIRFRPVLRPGPRWGSSRRFPRPPTRLGRGYPLPIPHPLDAFGVSVSSPAATRPRRLRRLVPKTPPNFFSAYGPAHGSTHTAGRLSWPWPSNGRVVLCNFSRLPCTATVMNGNGFHIKRNMTSVMVAILI